MALYLVEQMMGKTTAERIATIVSEMEEILAKIDTEV